MRCYRRCDELEDYCFPAWCWGAFVTRYEKKTLTLYLNSDENAEKVQRKLSMQFHYSEM